MERVDVAIILPLQHQWNPDFVDMNAPDWPRSEVVWEIPAERDVGSREIHFYSRLPHGWIPDDEFDFLRLLFEDWKKRWIQSCEVAESYLCSRVSKRLV